MLYSRQRTIKQRNHTKKTTDNYTTVKIYSVIDSFIKQQSVEYSVSILF
ncbi:Uncharacterised protein [Vibrio cholerae]|nr:Uncharacterised protein [Vibrio cholerae]